MCTRKTPTTRDQQFQVCFWQNMWNETCEPRFWKLMEDECMYIDIYILYKSICINSMYYIHLHTSYIVLGKFLGLSILSPFFLKCLKLLLSGPGCWERHRHGQVLLRSLQMQQRSVWYHTNPPAFRLCEPSPSWSYAFLYNCVHILCNIAVASINIGTQSKCFRRV